MLAHELRNPLAPLRSGLELLRKAPDDKTALQRTRPMMERQLRQLEQLVKDLLDVGRINDGTLALRRERVELEALVRVAVEASQPLIDAAGHSLELQLPPESLWLDADPTRMAQVLSNLLNNAAMATPPKGHIMLRVRPQGDDAEVCVIDNGAGMDAPTLQRVMGKLGQGATRPVQQPDGDGFGVGLALVRQLVALHGGEVKAHSDGPGQGSRFTLLLPQHPLRTAPAAEPDAVAMQVDGVDLTPGIGRRVLVVDDNRDAGESLAMLLQLGGHTTRVAYNGVQALEVAADFAPQLVFLDIGMPGMDGYAVAKALRVDPRTRQAMLVALTGWGAEDDRERTRAAGFDHHLTKPADPLAIDAVLLAADGRTAR
jgi:CheY-like chemotaxis protein